MKLYIDRADPGQWAFGIVSWPVTDSTVSREVYFVFLFWAVVVAL